MNRTLQITLGVVLLLAVAGGRRISSPAAPAPYPAAWAVSPWTPIRPEASAAVMPRPAPCSARLLRSAKASWSSPTATASRRK